MTSIQKYSSIYICIYIRRVLAFRRAHEDGDAKKKEPGITDDIKKKHEVLRRKDSADEPGSSGRTRLRKQCDPQGPVGYLLESVHLQASAAEKDTRTIWQYIQAPIEIIDAPLPAPHTYGTKCGHQEPHEASCRGTGGMRRSREDC